MEGEKEDWNQRQDRCFLPSLFLSSNHPNSSSSTAPSSRSIFPLVSRLAWLLGYLYVPSTVHRAASVRPVQSADSLSEVWCSIMIQGVMEEAVSASGSFVGSNVVKCSGISASDWLVCMASARRALSIICRSRTNWRDLTDIICQSRSRTYHYLLFITYIISYIIYP